jgi:hypothetical protein
MPRAALLLALLPLLLSGCLGAPPAPRGFGPSLLADSGEAEPDPIAQQLDAPLRLRAPVSAGIAWLAGVAASSHGYGYVHPLPLPLSAYQRTGILEATRDALAGAPFRGVFLLPELDLAWEHDPEIGPLDELRAVAARSQVEVAVLLRTSLGEASGLNPWALGWIGIVTVPLFPGNDLGAAAAAELCALDVRSGLVLACDRGRASAERRRVFAFERGEVRAELAEETLRAAAADGAVRLRVALADRLARGAARR